MLTINNLNKVYPDGTHALRNINLELPTGMVGLLGPNGAGKSSLMRTIATLQAADGGSISFDNINVIENPLALRKKLGYLPQYFGVYPNMSCRQLLRHMAELKGIHDNKTQQQQIDALLELTNLTGAANRKVASFSGGMRQRFGIAQSLLGNPQLLIMDEPTSGLDPLERERLHNVLVNISENKLILLSTHIVEDIENLCPHVALMLNGEIIESTGIENLLSPLKNKVWLLKSQPQGKVNVLSESYRFGQPRFRVYAESQPQSDAEAVMPTLQDRYFFELNKEGIR